MRTTAEANVCPNCGQEDDAYSEFEYGPFKALFNELWQKVKCNKCGQVFHQCFEAKLLCQVIGDPDDFKNRKVIDVKYEMA